MTAVLQAVTNFYPRPPRGGRRHRGLAVQARHIISIHALREEGDRFDRGLLKFSANFYPRPPRGGRLLRVRGELVVAVFLSTPSARRATGIHPARRDGRESFLSTPSARRATMARRMTARGTWYFYPRPPRGGRQSKVDGLAPTMKFLSTPSARRATASWPSFIWPSASFLSTPSARRATMGFLRFPWVSPNFYPRPPRGGRHCPDVSRERAA